MEFGVVFQQHHGVEQVVVLSHNVVLDVVGADAVASKQSVDRCATLVCQTTVVGVSRNLVGINFRHPNVMPNFAVWKTITYRHWHRWCCQPRF